MMLPGVLQISPKLLFWLLLDNFSFIKSHCGLLNPRPRRSFARRFQSAWFCVHWANIAQMMLPGVLQISPKWHFWLLLDDFSSIKCCCGLLNTRPRYSFARRFQCAWFCVHWANIAQMMAPGVLQISPKLHFLALIG